LNPLEYLICLKVPFQFRLTLRIRKTTIVVKKPCLLAAAVPHTSKNRKKGVVVADREETSYKTIDSSLCYIVNNRQKLRLQIYTLENPNFLRRIPMVN